MWIRKDSPREVIIEAFKQWIIKDVELFLNFKELRNLTSHTYEEDIAKDVYEFIVNNYSYIAEAIVKLSMEISKIK